MEFSSKLTYVPKFAGNREAPEVERFSVTFRNPTTALKSLLVAKPQLKFNYNSEGKVMGGETTMPENRKEILDNMLVCCNNLNYTMDGEKKVIYDAKDLWSAPAYYDPLIDELVEHFKGELGKKVNEKN